MRVGIQSVTTAGNISGTWLSYVDVPATAGNFPNFTTVVFTLTNGTATLTRGQHYAIVFYALSGTWNSSNSIQFATLLAGQGQSVGAYPTLKAIIAGAASNFNGNQPDARVWCEDSGTGIYGNPILSGNNQSAWNSTANPNERGLKFSLQTGWTTTYQVLGIQGQFGITNSASTADLLLYDSSNNILQSKSFTATELYAGTTSSFQRTMLFGDTNLANLIPGTEYRITIKVTNASLGFTSFVYLTFANASYDNTWTDSNLFISTERGSSGVWTDTVTSCPAWKLLIADATATGGGGGGGLNIPIGMTGGIRG
jgi:hypothetical protein